MLLQLVPAAAATAVDGGAAVATALERQLGARRFCVLFLFLFKF